MATFTCRIGTPDGKVLVEDREAESADRLRHQLEAEGYYVFRVRPRSTFVPFNISLPSTWRRVQKKDLLILNRAQGRADSITFRR